MSDHRARDDEIEMLRTFAFAPATLRLEIKSLTIRSNDFSSIATSAQRLAASRKCRINKLGNVFELLPTVANCVRR